jgi:hypothetical protein
MLEIRSEQLESLSAYTAQAFEARAYAHLHRAWPEACERRGDEAVRASIRHAIGRARQYGISSERGVIRFLNAMYQCGDEFDTEPWAAAILTDASLAPQRKLDRLADELKSRAPDRPGTG